MEQLILGSKSPRRQELLRLMGLDFVVIQKDTDESFAEDMTPEQAVQHIALQKVKAFETESKLQPVLTADTIVVLNQEIIGKPVDQADATRILTALSDRSHQVMTACAILYQGHAEVFHETTSVHFRALSPQEIQHYITTYQPFDKAGAYGIQEWIGQIGITHIEGSYTNVMGLPTARLYSALKKIGAL